MTDPRITDKVAEVKLKIQQKIDAEVIEARQKISDALNSGVPIDQALAALDDVANNVIGAIDLISDNVVEGTSGTEGETEIPINGG